MQREMILRIQEFLEILEEGKETKRIGHQVRSKTSSHSPS